MALGILLFLLTVRYNVEYVLGPLLSGFQTCVGTDEVVTRFCATFACSFAACSVDALSN